ncbi:MAG TPA: PKD domain-containing protein, partial [Bacteroidetes bacterium]|nr:PKD domain-containing protein [Bacteroidota bacterium]
MFNAFVINNLRFIFPLLVMLQINYAKAQIAADFSADTSIFCAPLIVNFTDLSSGGTITHWTWDFGNGTGATGSDPLQHKNPSATYSTSGSYHVSLTVTDGTDSQTVTKSNFIVANPKPTALFTSLTPMEGCLPLNIQFQDASSSPVGIASWLWDFGDGNSDTIPNPIYNYTLPGNYPITLIVKDSVGCQSFYVHPTGVQASTSTANFSASSTAFCTFPANISFNNLSSGTGVISAFWDFGDGNTSTALMPNHTYTDTGLFSISLMIEDASGCRDTMIRDKYIVVNTPIASFNINTNDTCVDSDITFINTSPYGSGYTWLLGDGQTSNVTDTLIYSYADSGVYDITLISSFAGCVDSITKTIIVRKAKADFTADTTYSCKTPFDVAFTDSSENAVTWLWDFGDGTTDSLQASPAHTYTSYGNLPVSLTITDINGCVATKNINNFIDITQPTAVLNLSPSEGCIPLYVDFSEQSITNEPIVFWEWSFGNGSFSNDSTHQDSFFIQGTYTVNLLIFNSAGCSDTIQDSVVAGKKPIILFGPELDTLCIEDSIQFRDSSLHTQEWLWDFGDGSTSTKPEPGHAYTDTGYFDVTVIHNNRGCYDTLKVDSFVYIAPPKSFYGFEYNCDSVFDINFSDSSAKADTYFWDFGDGDSALIANPHHKYDSTGDYTVSLSIHNFFSGCSHSYSQSVYIRDPIADFTIDVDSGCSPLGINYNGGASNDADFYTWNFGSGQ